MTGQVIIADETWTIAGVRRSVILRIVESTTSSEFASIVEREEV